jgi:hypothetical protein
MYILYNQPINLPGHLTSTVLHSFCSRKSETDYTPTSCNWFVRNDETNRQTARCRVSQDNRCYVSVIQTDCVRLQRGKCLSLPSAVDWYNYTSIVLQKGTRYAMLRYARVNRANVFVSRVAAGSTSVDFDWKELFFIHRYIQRVLCEREN